MTATLDQILDAASRLAGKHPSQLSDEELGITCAKSDPNAAKFIREWIAEYGPPWKVDSATMKAYPPNEVPGSNDFARTGDSQSHGEYFMEPRSIFVEVQSRAQRALGDSAAPGPLPGESSHDYEVRLMTPHQPHSKQYSKSNLDSIRDPTARAMVADSIYRDSAGHVEPGVLRPRKIRDASGREMTAYDGDDGACWNQFNPPIRYVRKINVPGRA